MTILWTNAALEPKRKFKYIVTFTKLADFQFLAQTCDRPGVKVGMSEHKYFNKSFYHPGRVTWDPNPLNVKFVDIQKTSEINTIDTNQKLLQVLINSGLSGLINTDGSVVTIGKNEAVNSLGDVRIQVLNSSLELAPATPAADSVRTFATSKDGGIAEEWLLKNAWLESMKPDGLDYGSEDILTVTVQLRYDWAELKVRDGASLTDVINKFGPNENT